jgi:ribonuclease J
LGIRILVHRGTHEIGGSCVEISHGSTRIIIDLGLPLVGVDGERFNWRDYQKLPGQELQRMGILPNLAGLYAWDTDTRPVDALLISHPHQDHYGLLNNLNPSIPCFAGEGTRRLIELTSFFTRSTTRITNHQPFSNEHKFTIGSITVTPFLMDHSAFDSYSFLLEADDKKIIYSGDFREHGRKINAFDKFLKTAPKAVDALLLEGTMIGRQNEVAPTETDLEKEILARCKETDRAVLAVFSAQNIDRMVSFYRAALQSNRTLVVDPYAANVLECLKDLASLPSLSKGYKNLKIYFPRAICRLISDSGHKETMLWPFSRYKVTQRQIDEAPGRYLILMRSGTADYFEKMAGLQGATMIYSQWQGYLNEESMSRIHQLIKRRDMTMHQLHTAGHAPLATLKKAVQALQPKLLIPIHTDNPDAFTEHFPMTRVLQDGQLLELQ